MICIGAPISCQHVVFWLGCFALCLNSVFNVKALVDAFNQDKVLIVAFRDCGIFTKIRWKLYQPDNARELFLDNI